MTDVCLDHNGWLSPEGQFHPVSRLESHCHWALSNVGVSDTVLAESRGWARLSMGRWWAKYNEVTQAQYTFIWEWYEANKEWIKLYGPKMSTLHRLVIR